MQSNFSDFIFIQNLRNSNNKSENLNLLKKLISDIFILLEEWYLLNSSIKSRIELEYQIAFGDLELELNKKKEKIDLVINELNKFKNMTEYNDEDHYFNDIKQKNQLYRNIVKKIHPDVSKNKYDQLWDIVQLAYKKQDSDKLKTISIILDLENKLDNMELNNVIIILKNQLQKHQIELNMQINEEPFSLINSLKEPKWIESRRYELKNKIEKLDEKLNNKKRILNTITKLHLVS